MIDEIMNIMKNGLPKHRNKGVPKMKNPPPPPDKKTDGRKPRIRPNTNTKGFSF